tara:strand:+ start:365 stop:781 length:417 start_codon:yes stop_codon:yes gene_type:complete
MTHLNAWSLHIPIDLSCKLTFVQVEESKEEPTSIDIDTPLSDGEQPAMESTEENKGSDDATAVPEAAAEEAETPSSSDDKEAELVKEDDSTLPQPSEPEASESAGQEESAPTDEVATASLDSEVSSAPDVSIYRVLFL